MSSNTSSPTPEDTLSLPAAMQVSVAPLYSQAQDKAGGKYNVQGGDGKLSYRGLHLLLVGGARVGLGRLRRLHVLVHGGEVVQLHATPKLATQNPALHPALCDSRRGCAAPLPKAVTVHHACQPAPDCHSSR